MDAHKILVLRDRRNIFFVLSFLGGHSMSPKAASWPLEKLCSPIPEFLHSQENWILFCCGNLCQERIFYKNRKLHLDILIWFPTVLLAELWNWPKVACKKCTFNWVIQCNLWFCLSQHHWRYRYREFTGIGQL